MEKAKILLKDLPFRNLKAGDVFTEFNGDLVIKNMGPWYDGEIGYGSDGMTTFNKEEMRLLRMIWDNKEWFEDVKLSPVRWDRNGKSITLSFDKPIDLDDIGRLASGIERTLREHYKDTVKKMGWSDELIDVSF